MAEAIAFEQVSVRRGPKMILDRVDWQVAEGQQWVILGPNGAGKTTAVQIAATRLHPTSGVARVLGERLGRVDVFELRGRIGLASSALAGRIPGSEIVRNAVMTAAYGLTGRWRETYAVEDLERANQMLSLFGVIGLADRSFGTLSEGEKKRVQLARSMMSDPELLLLDEPAAGLDLGGRERLLHQLTTLATMPGAPLMVLVTHHLEEVPAGFTHAALMRGGQITAQGPISQVLTSRAVSQAFGLDVTVRHEAGRYWATAGASPFLPDAGYHGLDNGWRFGPASSTGRLE
ncbi:MAG: ABC transporter ATP-binding protein [Micrococcales bacterium]|nr:ABC transporter ATP-binding protein [Micrococcales bacterium]